MFFDPQNGNPEKVALGMGCCKLWTIFGNALNLLKTKLQSKTNLALHGYQSELGMWSIGISNPIVKQR